MGLGTSIASVALMTARKTARQKLVNSAILLLQISDGFLSCRNIHAEMVSFVNENKRRSYTTEKHAIAASRLSNPSRDCLSGDHVIVGGAVDSWRQLRTQNP